MGRVAGADVVEDGLTEDVPSSMVGYQKLRGELVCVVKNQDRIGKEAEWRVLRPHPSLVCFLRIFTWKILLKIENK